uniref:Uncharacterized protein n=1 Tax=Micrurus corallinus TaxID=54390 RepID=A0A2D4F8I5_MICCO
MGRDFYFYFLISYLLTHFFLVHPLASAKEVFLSLYIQKNKFQCSVAHIFSFLTPKLTLGGKPLEKQLMNSFLESKEENRTIKAWVCELAWRSSNVFLQFLPYLGFYNHYLRLLFRI